MATTYDEILTLFRELAEAQKTTDLQIKETSREIAELKSLFTSQ